jgi:23S rRNA pseudouridine1911/1915/1917 synthase
LVDQNHNNTGSVESSAKVHHFLIDQAEAGMRLDSFLATELNDLSRSMITTLIHSSDVLVGGVKKKAGYRIRTGDEISIRIPPPHSVDIVPEQVDFSIIYEDSSLAVIAKPPGLVVHPGCGHDRGTLVHGLLYECDTLSGISGELRPGIVHRLDKDTSGVMVVAKNDAAHQSLVRQFKDRLVKKVYHAIVDGRLGESSGKIIEPIGRHPVKRKKMAIRKSGGRYAATSWNVVEEFPERVSLVELHPETGRTHQIRVHLAHLGHPILGDGLYGRKRKFSHEVNIERQCLHASRISFTHPETGRSVSFKAPLWQDMEELLKIFRQD